MCVTVGIMSHSLPSILKRLLKQPTAPFHEYHVRAEIEALLTGCPFVKMKRDKFGNLLVTYKNGTSRSKPTWVFGAHMDHPAFVQGDDGWQFLGSSVIPEMDAAIKAGLRKSHGEIATWNFPVKISSAVPSSS
jgi:endoglucanase